MQHLLIIFLYMIRLSVVVSFAGLGNSIRSTALSGFGSIDSILLQRSRPFTVRHLSSTSSSSSDSGKENASNKTARKKPVVPPKSYPPSAEIDKRGISVEKKGQSRQNSAGRRVSEADRPQRPNPLRENKNYVSNPPTNAFEEFTQEFRQVIQSREFVPAMALYARMKEIKMHPRESILTGLLSICQRKEHLVNAIEIFADFIAAGIAPNESAYISLIRCYSDNGNVEEALELIEQMNIRKLEPKLRTYHPILEAVCKENDFESAILIIKQMQVSNVVPRSEQVTLLLEVAASSRGLYTTQGQEQIEQILQSASIDLLGMETEEMRRVVAAFCRKTSEEVLEEGILVETRDDLPGEILEISDNSKASKLRAMNNTYVNVPTVISDVTVSPSVIDVTVPYGFDWMNSQVKSLPDIYTIASESESLGGNEALGLRGHRARMVDITKSDSTCPNCGAELVPLLLAEEERKRVRLGLMKIASTTSMQQLKNMQAYGEWLKNQTEFKYIIDGANVAYHFQNFDNGRFSYRQVELVVDKMLARGDGKVLVLLPYSYAQKVVPNSSKQQRGKRNLSFISSADMRILQRFDEEGMLYLVPQGADDDWYWIYATVTDGREKTAYVVTNDLMRDHRLAFLEPRPFIRWRTTQVINFCFSKAAKDDSTDPEVYIIDPGKYSREIQTGPMIEEGKEIVRWHVPASDRNAWLCLTTAPDSSTPSPPHSSSSSYSSSFSTPSSSSSSPTSSSVSSSSSDSTNIIPPIETIITANEVVKSKNAPFKPQARRKLY